MDGCVVSVENGLMLGVMTLEKLAATLASAWGMEFDSGELLVDVTTVLGESFKVPVGL